MAATHATSVLAAASRLDALLAAIQPSPCSEFRRLTIAHYVCGIIKRCFLPNQVEAFLFGSVPLRAVLPDGDIDISVFTTAGAAGGSGGGGGGSNGGGGPSPPAPGELRDTWASQLLRVLEREAGRPDAPFKIRDVQIIQAEVKLVKCVVSDVVVDVSFDTVGGLCTVAFLEAADRRIGKQHLFKRSILLLKAWCYYESRLLGAHHGLISSYALEVLVLYIFNLHHTDLHTPLDVLRRFLSVLGSFDWEQHCLALQGPLPLADLHTNPHVDATLMPSGAAPLLDEDFQRQVLERYSVRQYLPTPQQQQAVGAPTAPGAAPEPGSPQQQQEAEVVCGGAPPVPPLVSPHFPLKHLNILDPLLPNNNLGRSVSKASYARVKKALALGSRTLEAALVKDPRSAVEAVDQLFRNTWRSPVRMAADNQSFLARLSSVQLPAAASEAVVAAAAAAGFPLAASPSPSPTAGRLMPSLSQGLGPSGVGHSVAAGGGLDALAAHQQQQQQQALHAGFLHAQQQQRQQLLQQHNVRQQQPGAAAQMAMLQLLLSETGGSSGWQQSGGRTAGGASALLLQQQQQQQQEHALQLLQARANGHGLATSVAAAANGSAASAGASQTDGVGGRSSSRGDASPPPIMQLERSLTATPAAATSAAATSAAASPPRDLEAAEAAAARAVLTTLPSPAASPGTRSASAAAAAAEDATDAVAPASGTGPAAPSSTAVARKSAALAALQAAAAPSAPAAAPSAPAAAPAPPVQAAALETPSKRGPAVADVVPAVSGSAEVEAPVAPALAAAAEPPVVVHPLPAAATAPVGPAPKQPAPPALGHPTASVSASRASSVLSALQQQQQQQQRQNQQQVEGAPGMLDGWMGGRPPLAQPVAAPGAGGFAITAPNTPVAAGTVGMPHHSASMQLAMLRHGMALSGGGQGRWSPTAASSPAAGALGFSSGPGSASHGRWSPTAASVPAAGALAMGSASAPASAAASPVASAFAAARPSLVAPARQDSPHSFFGGDLEAMERNLLVARQRRRAGPPPPPPPQQQPASSQQQQQQQPSMKSQQQQQQPAAQVQAQAQHELSAADQGGTGDATVAESAGEAAGSLAQQLPMPVALASPKAEESQDPAGGSWAAGTSAHSAESSVRSKDANPAGPKASNATVPAAADVNRGSGLQGMAPGKAPDDAKPAVPPPLPMVPKPAVQPAQPAAEPVGAVPSNAAEPGLQADAGAAPEGFSLSAAMASLPAVRTTRDAAGAVSAPWPARPQQLAPRSPSQPRPSHGPSRLSGAQHAQQGGPPRSPQRLAQQVPRSPRPQQAQQQASQERAPPPLPIVPRGPASDGQRSPKTFAAALKSSSRNSSSASLASPAASLAAPAVVSISQASSPSKSGSGSGTPLAGGAGGARRPAWGRGTSSNLAVLATPGAPAAPAAPQPRSWSAVAAAKAPSRNGSAASLTGKAS